jgi:cytochrome c553
MKPFLSSLFAIAVTGSILAAEPAPVASYAICSACHAPDGKGLNAGTPMPMAPSLAGSKLATAGDGEVLAAIILNGI